MKTTIVDEADAPVTIERIAPGSPPSIQYTGAGEQIVASRIVLQNRRPLDKAKDKLEDNDDH